MSAAKDSFQRLASGLRRLVGGHGGRFLRFGLVGLSGVLLNFSILILLVEVFGLHYLIAGIVATEAAILNNFMFNDRWTFRAVDRSHSWVSRLARYHSVALGGMLISVAVLAALVGGLGLPYLIANGASILTAMLWNYSGNSLITWASPDKEPAWRRLSQAGRHAVRFAATQLTKVLG